jgi:hypothetical protein
MLKDNLFQLINVKFISLRTIRSKKKEEKTGTQSLGNQIGVMKIVR